MLFISIISAWWVLCNRNKLSPRATTIFFSFLISVYLISRGYAFWWFHLTLLIYIFFGPVQSHNSVVTRQLMMAVMTIIIATSMPRRTPEKNLHIWKPTDRYFLFFQATLITSKKSMRSFLNSFSYAMLWYKIILRYIFQVIIILKDKHKRWKTRPEAFFCKVVFVDDWIPFMQKGRIISTADKTRRWWRIIVIITFFGRWWWWCGGM